MNNKNLLFVLTIILIGIIAVAVIDTSGNKRIAEQEREHYSTNNDISQVADRNS